MGTLMLQVYNDAKKLTLSAYSWPSRVVAAQIASEFIFNNEQHEVKLDLQYISPAYHRELLQVIVDSHRQTSVNTIKEALASSLRCDGSVDRTQVEKIFTMLKIIVGAKEPEKTGAAGCLDTLKDSCIETEAGMKFSIIQEISSIVTDGTNMNSGERGGLWVLLEKLRQQQTPDKESLIPLIKILCTVHRSNLAWKSVMETVTELRVLIEELKGISTYFHTSGVRTRERKTIAEKYKLPIRRYPVYFQIRFTEFLFELIDAHLSSWNATTLYFRDQSKEHEEDGYFKLMTNKFKLQLMAFIADVLAVFKRYQKLIQDDGITILEVESRTKTVRTQIRSLSTKPLSGGWEGALLSALSEDGDSLKGIKLQDARR